MLGYDSISEFSIGDELVIALSNVNNLVSANSLQANGSSTGVITRSILLISANSSQASNSLAVAVTATIILTGVPSTQANGSSTGVITRSILLISANSTQNNSATVASILKTVGLTVDSSIQANYTPTLVVNVNNGTTLSLNDINAIVTAILTDARYLSVRKLVALK